jgi:arginase
MPASDVPILGNHVDDGLSEHRPEFVGRHAVRICQVDFVAMPRHLGHQAKDQKLGGCQAFRRIFSHWNKTGVAVAADLVVIGVASSAGTHHAGQDRAPQALREAGLLDRLRSAGLSVDDHGDVVTEVFAVDHSEPTRRNLRAVVDVARAVADLVADVDAHGSIPLVIGGDCTITIGVVAGMQRRRPHLGLFYFDGDADLSTPETTASGVLDAMGVAHLIGLADTELAGLAGQRPMLADQRLVLFGCDESDPETFHQAVLGARPHLRRFADHQVRADPAGCAAAALSMLLQASDGFILQGAKER